MRLLALSILLAAPLNAAAPAPVRSVLVDPPRDMANPAHNQQLLIPSHGSGMNALLFSAAGAGPHPTVILMHGLPGNERNLDLAQAIRRSGWNVLTFTYRGAWGSPGDFSIANAIDDTAAALDFARSAEGAALGIDPKHIILAGHSMGGAAAALTAARADGLDGLILLDAWNIADEAKGGVSARAELIKGFDDFGNALHGASPPSIADEVLAKGSQWDLVGAASHLKSVPVLTVTARYGIGAGNRPVTAALRAAGGRVSAVELNSDHAFADHRLELAAVVVGWLKRLKR